jgi:RsiW-degrading membrane proteinase PrsW (M82 family)
MTGMGRHSGEAAAPVRLPRRRLLALALGITATLVAWGFLVWSAIDFGSRARGGEEPAWIVLGLATVGATACLLVTLILATKVVAAVRGEVAPRPVVPGGRRRAR